MSSDQQAISAEFDLLCSIARPTPHLAQARTLLARGIDFPALLELALEHHVQPLLIRGLAAISWEGVPSSIKATLESFRQNHLLRVLSLSEELGRVADLFTSSGIPFAAFKGAVLAADLYGELSWREYNDVDLIVPRERTAEAERLLATLGYHNRQGDLAFRQTFLAYQRQYAFVRDGLDAAIDLHWHFCAIQLPFPVQPHEIWSALTFVRVGACVVPTLSGANLALLLAGHGTKESWKSLAWICDFAMLVERRPDLDWSDIHRRAHLQGCGDTVLLGCAMAAGLLETEVPRALAEAVDRSRRVRGIAAELIRLMRQGLSAMSPKRHLADLDLCDRRRDRIKAMLGFALTPTPGDDRAMPLPPALWRLHYLVRPIRLVAKGFAGLLARR